MANNLQKAGRRNPWLGGVMESLQAVEKWVIILLFAPPSVVMLIISVVLGQKFRKTTASSSSSGDTLGRRYAFHDHCRQAT